ncbi:hypothetical protein [uncultured Paraglaciecola sp.]|uniref:hypothetical protein n=1 Tax=uncultured Paraglaciecola sp. TaxID=1765024 RepID=UPI00260C8AAF|nr:hypothetical protein [uncultured Paraglaciecola sp.]
MTFSRRKFITALTTLAVSHPLTPSIASNKKSDHESDKDRKDLTETWQNPGFIRLETLSTLIQINNIIILTALTVYFLKIISLRSITRNNENRLSVPKSVPLFGSLFEKTYDSDDFSPQNKLGLAYTHNNSLILDLVPNRPQAVTEIMPDFDLEQEITRLDQQVPPIGKNLILNLGATSYSSERIDLLNSDYSYRIASNEAKVATEENSQLPLLSKTPLISHFFKNKVGAVYGSRNLHILVKPSIVENN